MKAKFMCVTDSSAQYLWKGFKLPSCQIIRNLTIFGSSFYPSHHFFKTPFSCCCFKLSRTNNTIKRNIRFTAVTTQGLEPFPRKKLQKGLEGFASVSTKYKNTEVEKSTPLHDTFVKEALTFSILCITAFVRTACCFLSSVFRPMYQVIHPH